MHGDGLTQTILLGGDGAGLVVCFALLAVSGLPRPFEWRIPVKPRRRVRPRNTTAPSVDFTRASTIKLLDPRCFGKSSTTSSPSPRTGTR